MKFSSVLVFLALLLPGADAFHVFSKTKRISARTSIQQPLSSSSSSTISAEKELDPNNLLSSKEVKHEKDPKETPPPLSSLPLPPTKKGFLRRFRDTFSYLKDPEKFVLERAKELGPVFQMYQFFEPVVVVGGQEAVTEFILEREASAKVIYPSLPPPFIDLQTEWSSLNMDSTQESFKEARGLFKIMLQSPEARNFYVRSILPEIEAYTDHLMERVRANPDAELYIVPELKELCLQIFSKIFSGEGLSKEQIQMFLDYNDSLFTLSKNTKQFKIGMASREKLCAEFLQRFKKMEERAANGKTDGEGMFAYQCFKDAKGFLDVQNYERISIGIFLMIWGAYVECAAMMINSAVCMIQQKLSPTETVLKEFKYQKANGLSRTTLEFWDGMKYTNGIIKETFRTVPPGAGLIRSGKTDFSLAGYRIPKGMGVMLDPRIGNRDSNLFQQADSFEPLRWVPESTATAITRVSTSASDGTSTSSCPLKGTALKLGLGSWFPGGNGAHRCPGVPLAELVSTMFLASLSEHFDSWELGGSGLNADGSVKYVTIPIQISPDNLGLKFSIRE